MDEECSHLLHVNVSPAADTPGSVFDKVGVDYAGPVLVKYGHVRNPTVIKAYICVFVSLSVKRVHLKLVTCRPHFRSFYCLLETLHIARRGLHSLIWSDNGTDFTGAQATIYSRCCYSCYLDERKSLESLFPNMHPTLVEYGKQLSSPRRLICMRRILGDVKLTYEDLSTLLSQIEACLNSRLLVPLRSDDDEIGALTSGHCIIGKHH